MNDRDADALPGIVLRKVTLRLVPFLCLLYILNILDRVNAGFAGLTMLQDVKMSKEAFDWCFGLFYFGYLLFEVPSNLLLRRVGARRWISRIMISWGLVTCATVLVTGPWSFALLRILLGVAEAGFFPGIVLYLTFWFPARERARVMAFFMAASPLAGLIGNPINGAIMQYMNGVGGWAGWQWLFLLEGLPSVLVGFAVLWWLTDRPEQATWLSDREREWLADRMNQEEQRRHQRHGSDLLAALNDARVWLLIGVYFTVAVSANSAGAYFPRLLSARLQASDEVSALLAGNVVGSRSENALTSLVIASCAVLSLPGWKESTIGLLLALPSLCAVIMMTLLGARSDRTGERRKHLAFAGVVGAAGWALAARTSSPWLFLVGLCLAQAGTMSMLPIFWALPTSFLSGAAAAGGIALINSLGNVGGLVGPRILGEYGPWSMAGILFAGSVLALGAWHDPRLDRAPPADKA
jgi:ACS family tartrate transporter-like MFS transporter